MGISLAAGAAERQHHVAAAPGGVQGTHKRVYLACHKSVLAA
jgi:hypothetical protein